MVEWPNQYKWSSYTALIGEVNEGIIDSAIILRYFKYQRRYELYREFVEKKLKELREILMNQEQEKQEGSEN